MKLNSFVSRRVLKNEFFIPNIVGNITSKMPTSNNNLENVRYKLCHT